MTFLLCAALLDELDVVRQNGEAELVVCLLARAPYVLSIGNVRGAICV
jgi:hypothetical protein